MGSLGKPRPEHAYTVPKVKVVVERRCEECGGWGDVYTGKIYVDNDDTGRETRSCWTCHGRGVKRQVFENETAESVLKGSE